MELGPMTTPRHASVFGSATTVFGQLQPEEGSSAVVQPALLNIQLSGIESLDQVHAVIDRIEMALEGPVPQKGDCGKRDVMGIVELADLSRNLSHGAAVRLALVLQRLTHNP